MCSYLAGSEIITNTKILQNVTANASIITNGELSIERMPRDAVGLIIEAQGAGFYPMYVNPNGRYEPAAHSHDYAPSVHTHAAVDIISGILAEARLPNVYTGAITFNGGVTASDYKSSFGNSGITTAITYLKNLAGDTGTLTFQNGTLTGAT